MNKYQIKTKQEYESKEYAAMRQNMVTHQNKYFGPPEIIGMRPPCTY